MMKMKMVIPKARFHWSKFEALVAIGLPACYVLDSDCPKLLPPEMQSRIKLCPVSSCHGLSFAWTSILQGVEVNNNTNTNYCYYYYCYYHLYPVHKQWILLLPKPLKKSPSLAEICQPLMLQSISCHQGSVALTEKDTYRSSESEGKRDSVRDGEA